MPPAPVSTPPASVRWRYHLGMPVATAWRPWAAQRIMAKDIGRSRRLTLLYVPILFGYLWFTTGGSPSALIPAMGGMAFGYAATWRASDSDVRARMMRWHGLRPDGTVDPDPNGWLSFAHLRPWQVTLTFVALYGSLAALLVASFLYAAPLR